jgi:hypothetical protein
MRLGPLTRADVSSGSHPRSTRVAGLRLHTGTSTRAQDRAARRRLCRYAGRPAIATERLDRLSDGRLAYARKRAWRDGTPHVASLPQEFLEKLCGLVPPPRVNRVRDHRALAPGARLRRAIVAQAVADGAQAAADAPDRTEISASPRPSSAGSARPPPAPISDRERSAAPNHPASAVRSALGRASHARPRVRADLPALCGPARPGRSRDRARGRRTRASLSRPRRSAPGPGLRALTAPGTTPSPSTERERACSTPASPSPSCPQRPVHDAAGCFCRRSPAGSPEHRASPGHQPSLHPAPPSAHNALYPCQAFPSSHVPARS